MKKGPMMAGCGCLGIIVILALIVGGMFMNAKNRMVLMNENIDGQWAQVENQLKRRHDLIPNLVNTVKGYAKHEKTVFTDIANARAKLAGAQTVDQKVEANNQLQSALSRLLVVVERYPTLKADVHFTALMDELNGTENRISVERMRYNEAVKEYNTYIKMIPGSLFASVFNYQPRKYFEVGKSEQETPTVDFDK